MPNYLEKGYTDLTGKVYPPKKPGQPLAPWMGQLPSYAPWLQQGTPAQNLMAGVQGLTGGYADIAMRVARAASQPYRPAPTLPSQRPPTPEEKAQGTFMYQPTGADEKAYEEWQAPSVGTEALHMFTLPWTKEETKPWDLSVKTPLEELAYLPLWMTGTRGAVAPAKVAAKAIEKRTPQIVKTALREEVGMARLPGRAITPKPEVKPIQFPAQRRAMEKTLATVERLHKEAEAGEITTVSWKQVVSRGWHPNTGIVYSNTGGRVADRMSTLQGRFIGDKISPIGHLRGTDADPWIYFTRVDKKYRTPLYTDPAMSGSEKLVSRLREPPITPLIETRIPQTVKTALKEETGALRLPGRAVAKTVEVPPQQRAIQKLIDVLKIEKPLMRETQQLHHVALQEKAARIGRTLEAPGEAESVLAQATKMRSGTLPTLEGEGLRPRFEPEEVSELFNSILKHPTLRNFEKVGAYDAFIKLIDTQLRMTKSEIKLLGEVFGPEFAARFRTLPQKILRGMLEAAGLLRALVASGEFSATLRQGASLLARRPYMFPKMIKEQVKYTFSAKQLEKADALIKAHPKFKLWNEAGGYTAPLPGKAAQLWQAEETFMSSFTRHIPIVAQTERAYVGGLNWLRFNSFVHAEKMLAKQGLTTEKTVADLAKLINIASGRGDAKFLRSEIGPILNSLLFSPRFQLAKVQFPKYLFDPAVSPAIRKEAWKMMTAHLAFGTGILSMLVMAGGTLELDPRSSDFGKVKIGETRLDFWSGYAQYVRFLAQLSTNQRKKTTTGAIVDLNRIQTGLRFFQSKLSPAAGLINDIMSGQTFLGEEMAWEEETMKREAFRRTVPFWWQDMVDAITEEGMLGGLVASVGFLGVGVVTHTPLEGPGARTGLPRQMVSQIENQIYSKYPPQVRQQLEQIKSLERTDPSKARKFLFQHPELMSIRMEIARAQQQTLMQQGQTGMAQRQTEMQEAMRQRQAKIQQQLGGG